VQATPQLRFPETEALGDAGQIPDRIDRRLHHPHAAARGHDIAVGANATRRDGRADFRHVDVSAGHRNARPDVVAAHEVVAERLADEMSPRVERHDLFRIEPLRVRSDALDRRRIGQVGHVIIGERSGRNCQRAINRVTAGMASNGIAMIGVAQGRDHGSAFARGRRAPHDLWPLRHGFYWRSVRVTE
jgi:hypothetical protein